jgi:hypothetical protein
LTDGGDCNISPITFQRTWLRPWAFFALEEKALRDELLQLFPGGAYVAFDREKLSSPNWRQIQIFKYAAKNYSVRSIALDCTGAP